MSAWAIRPGREADVEPVLTLWCEADSLPSATDSQEALERLLARDPGSLFIAQANGKVVGSLIVGWDGWRGSFYRLAVHPRWRRRGLATALVRAGEDRLRELGAIRLTAIVVSEKRDATALWDALGYSRQAGTSRFVRMLGHPNDR